MGPPNIGFKPTARMYKLTVLVAAAAAVCFTMWMASSLLGTELAPAFGSVVPN
ncbi:hypothetical protein LPJ70_007857, partial [Coemansia sp. RSA 2708]